MLLNCFLLAICVSIDSLSIGVTYGLKNTKISFGAKCILFCISIIVTTFSVFLGSSICKVFPSYVSCAIGSILLCLMGVWIIVQAITKNKDGHSGVTVQIIRDPSYSDFNNSNQIEAKEALYLGIALSLDSIGIGIGSSIMGLNTFLFPILVASFQLFFLSLGGYLGKKIKDISNIPENIWGIVSGILLIFVGISKIVF
ncbi:MAG: sporulation membrane protein YtaF [Clostridia bacterium]|nr:sporulation membrane protein YtaF [Clostridia bacterium]